MKRILSLILCAVLVAMLLTGCGAKRKLLGTWQADMDLSEVMGTILQEQWSDNLFPVENFTVTMELTFLRDNTFIFILEQGSVQTAAERLLADMETALTDRLNKQLQDMDKTVTLEDLLGVTGVDLDSLLSQFRQTFAQVDFAGQLRKKMQFSGWYKLSGGKLYISETEEFPKDGFYFTYAVEDGVLTLSPGGSGAPMEQVLTDSICALQYQKVS